LEHRRATWLKAGLPGTAVVASIASEAKARFTGKIVKVTIEVK
jgi:hypothetical protein